MDRLGGDFDPRNIFGAWQIEHDVEQGFLEDRAKATGTRPSFEGRFSDRY